MQRRPVGEVCEEEESRARPPGGSLSFLCVQVKRLSLRALIHLHVHERRVRRELLTTAGLQPVLPTLIPHFIQEDRSRLIQEKNNQSGSLE